MSFKTLEPMTTLRVFILFAFLFVVSGCNHHSLSSRAYATTTTNGVGYAWELAHLDKSPVPIILMARSDGPGKDYSFSWESRGDGQVYVDGTPLAVVSQPTAYYKEDGRLKSKVISESGVWVPLLRGSAPTTEELARAFDAIESGSP